MFLISTSYICNDDGYTSDKTMLCGDLLFIDRRMNRVVKSEGIILHRYDLIKKFEMLRLKHYRCVFLFSGMVIDS